MSATVNYSHCYVARCPECQALVAASCFFPADEVMASNAAVDASEWLERGEAVCLVDVRRDGPPVFSEGHVVGCSRGER